MTISSQTNEQHNQDFTGFVYPAAIWLDQHLSANEKNLLAEVYSLEKLVHGCTASNEHFASRLNVNTRSVTRLIRKLSKKDYLRIVSFDGRNRQLEVNMDKLEPRQEEDSNKDNNLPHNLSNKASQKVEPAPTKLDNLGTPPSQNVEPSSTKTAQTLPKLDNLGADTGKNVETASSKSRTTIVNKKSTNKNKKTTGGDFSKGGLFAGVGKAQKKSTNKKPQTKTKTSADFSDIPLPFASAAFVTAWRNWLTYRREIKKPYRSAMSVQQTLAKLARYEEAFALELIEKSIANGWQGLIFPQTGEQYQKWLAAQQRTKATAQGTGTRAQAQPNLLQRTQQTIGICRQIAAFEKQQANFKNYSTDLLQRLTEQLRELWRSARSLQMFGSELARISRLGKYVAGLVESV
jgi:hypothetical protein